MSSQSVSLLQFVIGMGSPCLKGLQQHLVHHAGCACGWALESKCGLRQDAHDQLATQNLQDVQQAEALLRAVASRCQAARPGQ